MKILHFADLHLDTPFRWAPPELARRRRMALRDTLQAICKLAADLQVDALTCGGDLFEQERFTPDTAEFLRCAFANLDPLPVYLAPGNHDWLGPVSLYRHVAWSPNVVLFDESRLQPRTLAEGLTLWGAAHCAPANTPGFLDGFHVDRGGVHLGLFHGSAQGGLPFEIDGTVPHAPFRREQIEQAGLHHALLGHFHQPTYASDYTYPGNPDPLSFGETGERGAVLLTIGSGGQINLERHAVASSVVEDVPVDLTGVTHSGQVMDRVVGALAGRGGVVRVTLSGEIGAEVDVRLQDITCRSYPNIDALVARLGTITYAYDFDTLADEHTVRGQFVHDVRAATSLSDEQRRRVLVTGLRAFEHRDDLDVR